MIKKIRNICILLAWGSIFFLYPLGNTSLGIVMLLIALILGYKPENLIDKFSYIEYRLIGLFSLLMLISSFQSIKPFDSIALSIGQILVFFLVFLGSDYLIQNKEKLYKYFLCLLLISGIISGSVAIYNYLSASQWFFRTETLFTGVNGTGTVLLVTIALSIVVTVKMSSRIKRLVAYVALLLPLGGLALTQSRGALLGFFGVIATFLLRSKKGIVIFLIFSILMVSSICFFVPNGPVRLLSIFSFEKNQARLTIWQSTLKMIKDNPLLGVGPGMFAHQFPNYSPDSVKENFSLAHNLELQIAAEFGLIGFILFFALIILILKRNIELIKTNPDNILYRGILAALIGYLIHNQVDGTMMGFEIGSFFWLLCGLVVHEYYNNRNKNNLAKQ